MAGRTRADLPAISMPAEVERRFSQAVPLSGSYGPPTAWTKVAAPALRHQRRSFRRTMERRLVLLLDSSGDGRTFRSGAESRAGPDPCGLLIHGDRIAGPRTPEPGVHFPRRPAFAQIVVHSRSAATIR